MAGRLDKHHLIVDFYSWAVTLIAYRLSSGGIQLNTLRRISIRCLSTSENTDTFVLYVITCQLRNSAERWFDTPGTWNQTVSIGGFRRYGGELGSHVVLLSGRAGLEHWSDR